VFISSRDRPDRSAPALLSLSGVRDFSPFSFFFFAGNAIGDISPGGVHRLPLFPRVRRRRGPIHRRVFSPPPSRSACYTIRTGRFVPKRTCPFPPVRVFKAVDGYPSSFFFLLWPRDEEARFGQTIRRYPFPLVTASRTTPLFQALLEEFGPRDSFFFPLLVRRACP